MDRASPVLYKPGHPATLVRMTILWSKGQWLDAGDFAVTPTDRGISVGLGLFETILAVDGTPVFAERHLARLRAGCARLGWQPELPQGAPLLRELLQRNRLTTGRTKIRLAITGGSGPLHGLTLGPDHQIWMTAAPVADAPLTTTASLSPWVRNERSPLAGLKCASYAENLLALEHAAQLGFDQAVLLNSRGKLCEAATANLFWVKDGQLLTPTLASGCLPGITRGVVIELADQLGLPCTQADLPLPDLLAADEWFLTSSIHGPVGVTRLDERDFPPGPLTHALRAAWNAVIQRQLGS